MLLPMRTRRLVVRMLALDDLETFVAYRNDPEVGRFQDWALPFTRETAHSLLDGQSSLSGPTDGEWVQLAIDHDGAMVGDLAVELRRSGAVATVGYTLASAQQGRGYATEALAGLVDALVADGVHRLVATLDPENVPSMRVLEAVGFTFESLARKADLIRGEWLDDLRYSLLAEDRVAWRDRDLTPTSGVELVEITPDDAHLWSRVVTHYSQERFVAPTARSFRDALFPDVVDGAPVVPWMRGVLVDGERAGFLMTALVTEHHPEPYLWRLLIGRTFQRRGIGSEVLRQLCDQLRAEGHSTLVTSWGEGPGSPRPFYESKGFVPTGRIVDDETEARLTL